jgi:glycosyltransferase involved in cell wall biosynthesis
VALVRRLRALRPDVLQTWMYHANLLGALARGPAGGLPLAWNIQNSAPGVLKRSTRATLKANALLSRRAPAAIVCCGEAVRDIHARLGFDARRMVVIPNAVNTSRFAPDPAARLALRAELGLPPETPLAGLVARFDPQKDHENFVKAAALLHAQRPDARFVLAGKGIAWENEALAGWIDAAGLRPVIFLLGPRSDAPALMAGLDVFSLSSRAEGLPLTVCEAMACATPVVATDVGDIRHAVGEAGVVVPPRDPAALAAGLARVLALEPEARAALGAAARARAVEHYGIEQAAQRYGGLYAELAAGRRAGFRGE